MVRTDRETQTERCVRGDRGTDRERREDRQGDGWRESCENRQRERVAGTDRETETQSR